MNRKDTVELNHPIAGERGRKTPAELLSGANELLQKAEEAEEAKNEKVSKSLPDLKDLIFFGRIKEKIEFGNFTFELTTLTNKQHKSLVSRLVGLKNNDEKLLNIKSYTLAESITSVNGIPLEKFAESEGVGDVFEKKVELINSFQSTLVEALFAKYEEITTTSNKLMSQDEVKEEIKK